MAEDAIEREIELRSESYDSVNKFPLVDDDYNKKEPWAYRREIAPTISEHFSSETHHIVMAPIQAEITNNHLYTFLRELHSQVQTNGPVGIVFLINENWDNLSHYFGRYGDEGMDNTPIPENIETAKFLSALQRHDVKAMKKLNIPDEYVTLAEDLAANNTLDIRFDYILINDTKANFGMMRKYLLNLAEAFASPDISPHDIIVHFQDVDTVIPSRHIHLLDTIFQDDRFDVNISEWDSIPGIQEGYVWNQDASREVLMSIDAYRAHKYAVEIASILNGTYSAGTPTMSGRLSALKHPEIQKTLTIHDFNEDYSMSSAFERIYNTRVTHVGEVYRVDRARNRGENGMQTDAQLRYAFTMIHDLRTVNAIYPEILRLESEAGYGNHAVRMLSSLISWRDELLSVIENPEKDRLLQINNDDIWESSPDHVRGLLANELQLCRQIVAEDIPEIMPLLDIADKSGRVGSLLFMKKVMESAVHWIQEEYPNRHATKHVDDYNSKGEQSDFSQYILRELFYWKSYIRDVRDSFTIPEETQEYIEYTKNLSSNYHCTTL